MWKNMLFGEICQITNGNSIPVKIKEKKFSHQNGMPYIATKDISFNGKVNYENGISISNDELKNFKIATQDSILICAEGGSAGRKIAYLDQNCCFVNKLFSIKASSQILPRFVFYYLKSEEFQSQFKKALTGLIGGVSLSKIKNFQITFPEELNSQTKIIEKLDNSFAEIDKTINSIENSLNMSSQLFQNTLKETFEELLNSAPKKTLRDISIEFGRGKSKHRPRNDVKLFGREIPFIQTGNIANAEFYIKDFDKQYSNFGIKQSKVWSKGTVCITIAANIAELGILDFDACFPDSIIGIYPDNKITYSEYIFYLLSFFQGYIKSKSKGSAQQNINLSTFETEKFPFPSDLKIQNKVVNKLNQIRLELTKYQGLMKEKLEKLKVLKSAILSKELKNKFL